MTPPRSDLSSCPAAPDGPEPAALADPLFQPTQYLILDCEVSSPLPGGFPIEVGWVGLDGKGENYLVKPQPGWTEWSPLSHAIHGLSPGALIHRGVPAPFVAQRVADVLAPSNIVTFSVAPSRDEQQIAALLACLDPRPDPMPRVRVYDVEHLYARACRPLLGLVQVPRGRGWASTEEHERALQPVKIIARAIVANAEEAEAARREWLPHRAQDDAERLCRTLRTVERGVARRMAEEGLW